MKALSAAAAKASLTWLGYSLVAAQVLLAGCLAFGGISVVLVQLENAFVDPGFLSSDQFTQSYALAAFAPGPNGPIFLSLLAMQAFGLIGVPIIVVAWALPSLFITHQLGRLSQAEPNPKLTRLLDVLKVTVIGLLAAGVLALLRAFDFAKPTHAAIQIVVAAVGLVLIVKFKVNPLVVLAGSMVLGAILI